MKRAGVQRGLHVSGDILLGTGAATWREFYERVAVVKAQRWRRKVRVLSLSRRSLSRSAGSSMKRLLRPGA